MYFIKPPFWLRALYPRLTWRLPAKEKLLYLTFDDGPHETATPFVLDTLKQYNAKASFFCIGKNVQRYPDIYQRILLEGHAVGNHTQNHLNGWKVTDEQYLDDVKEAAQHIHSNLFRPPYGRIRHSQQKKIQLLIPDSPLQTIMWDVLSADFDTRLSGETCLGYVLRYTRPGSIIVFHDSSKAWERMSYTLPKTLETFSKQGYRFEAI